MKKVLLLTVNFILLSFTCFSQSMWYRIYGGPRDDRVWSVLITRDNNVLAVGERSVPFPNNFYGPQTYLTKFDVNTGSILWQKIIGDSVYGNYAYSALEDGQ